MDLGELTSYALSPNYSDVTYITGIDQASIPGHKIVQASCSAYLSEIFAANKTIRTVRLPKPITPLTQELKADPTSKIIAFSYSKPELQTLLDAGFGRDNCLSYYSIANSLKFKNAETIILDYINENLMNPDNAAQFYLEATKFGHKDWEVKALDLLASNLDEILKREKDHQKIIDLPFESFKSLVKRDDLYIGSEDPLIELVMKYMKVREECPVNPKDMNPADLLKKAVEKANDREDESGEEDEDGFGDDQRGGRGRFGGNNNNNRGNNRNNGRNNRQRGGGIIGGRNNEDDNESDGEEEEKGDAKVNETGKNRKKSPFELYWISTEDGKIGAPCESTLSPFRLLTPNLSSPIRFYLNFPKFLS